MHQLREFEYVASNVLFTDIDCDMMLQSVEKIELELEYKVSIENPEVCTYVRDQCKLLNRLIPLVYKLQNKKHEITDRVAALIVAELGFDLWPRDKGAVTLRILLDKDILAHEQELNIIHSRATKESNIHKKLWILKHQLEELSLHVEADQGK